MANENEVIIKISTQNQEANKQLDETNKKLATTNDEMGEQETKQKSLRAQYKESLVELAKIVDKYGETSKEAAEAGKRSAELADKIDFVNKAAKAFNPDEKFKAVAGALTGVAGGFSAVQGVMALFGTENKKVEEALLKVNAAMALTSGLNAIGDSIDSFKLLNLQIQNSTTFQNANNAATKTAAAVQKAFGIEVEATSTGFKVLKGAIAATGIGLLVVLLGEVIANFDAIKKWIMDSPLGSLAKGVGNLVEGFTDLIGVTSEAERNLDKVAKATARGTEDIANRIKILQAQGGHEKEIHELKLAQIEEELKLLRLSLKTKGTLTDEEQKKFRELNTAKAVENAAYNKKVADDDKKANDTKVAEQKKTNDKIAAQNKKTQEEIAADNKKADELLLEMQNETKLAYLTSEEDKQKEKLRIDKEAKDKEIEELKISEEKKKALKLANEADYEAKKKEIDDAIKAERKEKDEAFETELADLLSETRIARLKDGKEKELGTLDEELVKETKAVLANADYTETQKTLLVTALKEKHGAEVAAITAKYDKEASEKEANRLKELIGNEDLSFKARKGYVDDAIKLNEKQYDEGKITLEEYTKTDKELSDTRKELAKKEAELRSEQMTKVANTLKNVSKALGEHTIAGKATAIAAATIETYQSATSAFASLAKIPIIGVPLGIAAAAAAIVAGIKNVKSIMAIQPPPVAGGASGPGFVDIPPPSGGGSAPSIPPSTGGGGGGALPDMGGGSAPIMQYESDKYASGGQGSVRAYVVERDITDSQAREREIQNKANFR
jgi:hypothetical protein